MNESASKNPKVPLERIQKILIDEWGFLRRDGELGPLKDPEFEREFFENLRKDSDYIFRSEVEDSSYFLEYFDAPLVVTAVRKNKNGSFQFHVRDVFSLTPDFETMGLDHWDRFLGYHRGEIPYVLSESAQDDFFQALDEFSDETLTVNGRIYTLPSWNKMVSSWEKKNTSARPAEIPVLREQSDWNQAYIQRLTPWDLQTPHPDFRDLLPRLKLNRLRVLVLGCGRGHDAAWMAQAGHIVTGVDVSKEALSAAESMYGHSDHLKWVHQDALLRNESNKNQFDLILEHTFFCALDPVLREDLVKTWLHCLTPHGYFMGIFFVMDKKIGPPYGGSEWEYRKFLQAKFRPLLWGRTSKSPEGRSHKELLVFLERK